MATQSDYAQVIGDIQQTATRGATTADLVARPVGYLLQRQEALNSLQSLRADLGEWAFEAEYKPGYFRQPVLRTDAFMQHLINHDAFFKPNGDCESTFGWAQLLYALDIRPGAGILAWRWPSRASNPAATGQIDLEMDGQVPCHIISLYCLYDGKFDIGTARNRLLNHGCKMPFGRIRIAKMGSGFVAAFRCTTTEELSDTRQPFQCETERQKARLNFEPGTVMTRYLNALDNDVSVSKAVLPRPEASLKERAQALVEAHKSLDPGKNTEFEACLITNAWFEKAERIIRRVTTNGDQEDMTLIDDIVAAFEKLPEVERFITAEKARSRFEWDKSHDPPLDREQLLRNLVTGTIKHCNEPFDFIWGSRRSSTYSSWEIFVAEHIGLALEPLAKMPQSTWKHDLSQMSDEMAKILRLKKHWNDRPGIVLGLSLDSEMWTADCLIQG